MLTLKRTINKALGGVAVLLFALLVVVTVWQVITRQVLNNPSTWSEELSKLVFVWLSFVGATFLFGERGHIAVDILARKFLPGGAQRALATTVQLVIAFFALTAMVWGGILAARTAWNQNLTALPVTIGWVYVVIPICGVIIAVYAVIDALTIAGGAQDPYSSGHSDSEPEPSTRAGEASAAGPTSDGGSDAQPMPASTITPRR